MSDKTKEQLEEEIKRRDLRDALLAEGDKRWAKKVIEYAVIGFITMVLTGFIGFLISLAFKTNGN